jgi:DNA-binding GntR family transcriptional regulator
MQKQRPTLHRPNLADDIAETIRTMVFDGRLSAGERLNEVHLAAELGVSRTPLREALAALAAEGALTNQPRLGYYVRELTIAEAESIYPIRAILDPEALKLAGMPSPDRFDKLESINDKLRAAKDVLRAIKLDNAWHRELWADCPNRVLTELIEDFMRRTQRYELASMRERRNVLGSTESHDEIVAHLRDRNMPRACRRLRRSLIDGAEPVIRWLNERDNHED